MRTRRDPRQMRTLLRRRERQGLTWAALAEVSGVPASTLQWWQRRLEDEVEEESPRFVRVDVGEVPPAKAEPIEVVLRGGHRLLVRKGFDIEALRRLVDALDA